MKKILIIEEEQSIQKALLTKLSEENLEVIQAFNGEEGLEMALSEKPDVIVLDILLPKLNGMEVAEKIREDEWGKYAKIMILSAFSNPEVLSKALKLDIFNYVEKTDIKIQDLVEEIKKLSN